MKNLPARRETYCKQKRRRRNIQGALAHGRRGLSSVKAFVFCTSHYLDHIDRRRNPTWTTPIYVIGNIDYPPVTERDLTRARSGRDGPPPWWRDTRPTGRSITGPLSE
ncbi:hypothetical protein PISMIDRAFT_12606 [Pisolithus microcarpus 441]|uniref:Uncharacterized protein n=1 Tax=Pisolithus microcarpus 441 TaxID=765257 RepID=A0A0C9ZME3_9AGAM|nr:hypothetical protein PISMIDRAFT_12606 [Pisolithus microcarpus 441]